MTGKYASRAFEMSNKDFISKLGGSIRLSGLSPSIPSSSSGSRVNTQNSLQNNSPSIDFINKE